MSQNLLITIFFFALLLLILYVAFLILRPFIVAITWAAILAVIFYPAYAWLLKLLRGRSSLAALIVTILLAFLIIFPALRIVDFLAEETVEVVHVVGNMANGKELETSKQESWIRDLLGIWDWAHGVLATYKIDLREALVEGAQKSSGFLASQVKGIAQNVFVFVMNILVALFTLFFFLRDGKELCLRIGRLLPMEPQHQQLLFTNIVDSIFAVVHGCLIVAMLQGLLAGLAYWILGVPFAILLGVATAFAALLPIGGSTIISLPASIYLFIQGNYVQGTILIGWSLGIVGTVDNLLKPIFIGSRLRLPVHFLFFSILGGLALFGALGLILGPVVFALLAALLDLYTKEYARA